MVEQITWHTRTMNINEWAEEFNMKPGTFGDRRRKGWSMSRIKHTPIARNGRPTYGEPPTKKIAECVPKKLDCRHPIVAAIFKEMNYQRCTYNMLAKRSGVAASTIVKMRSHGPGLFFNVEACANSLGLNIITVKE